MKSPRNPMTDKPKPEAVLRPRWWWRPKTKAAAEQLTGVAERSRARFDKESADHAATWEALDLAQSEMQTARTEAATWEAAADATQAEKAHADEALSTSVAAHEEALQRVWNLEDIAAALTVELETLELRSLWAMTGWQNAQDAYHAERFAPRWTQNGLREWACEPLGLVQHITTRGDVSLTDTETGRTFKTDGVEWVEAMASLISERRLENVREVERIEVRREGESTPVTPPETLTPGADTEEE